MEFLDTFGGGGGGGGGRGFNVTPGIRQGRRFVGPGRQGPTGVRAGAGAAGTRRGVGAAMRAANRRGLPRGTRAR